MGRFILDFVSAEADLLFLRSGVSAVAEGDIKIIRACRDLTRITTMPQTKEQKKKVVEELKEKIAKQKIVIFADFTKLKVKELSNLRKQLKKVDSELKVAKKTLSKIAFKEGGLEIDTKKLEGEIALIFGYKEEIPPAKTVYQFSQENPALKILGGFLENKLREAKEIVELAQLPTREELLAKLVGSISAPVSNFVHVLQANIKGLIFALSAIKK